MSSISSVGNNYSMMMSMTRSSRSDSTKLAEDLFSQLDTTGKGYIEKADLESAFQQLSSSSTTSTDAIFSSLDGNGDGKVTQEEMTSGLQSLMDSLDSQYESSRMSDALGAMGGMGGMGGMPPPPPPQDDTGFTEEELQSQLDEIGSTDSKRSALISSVLENFDAADTNSDGKVSFQEAMAYDQSTTSSTSTTTSTSSSSSDSTTASTSSATDSEAQLMLQIMKLAQAYGLFDKGGESSSVSALA